MTYNSATSYLVLQQLAQYGIEHIETIRVPEDIAYNKMVKVGDTKSKNKIKGFAFLEFSMHSVAAVTYQRLKKPDVVLGRDVSAKVSFEQSAKPSNDEDVPQDRVKLLMEGLELSLQERESKLYNDFDKFTSEEGETIHSYYLWFAKLINDIGTGYQEKDKNKDKTRQN
ncbi:hypothetical protein Tco_1004144 [Tanacetum coccineum]|uniref:RRM domain-containing protein n=1 Tax=Tanacetum coccineum TaxID=301880 RepID=A0ABQ5FBG2_9ASTR